MNQPTLEELLEKADSRYTLVAASAKRARQLLEGAERLIECSSTKPMTIALQEIGADRIRYERIKPISQ